jgi:hypothetical protein
LARCSSTLMRTLADQTDLLELSELQQLASILQAVRP